jgi:UDP-glucose 4-epimerase
VTDTRALITGGAGLVGSHLADALVRAGMPEIVVLDNFSRGRRENLDEATASGRVRIIEGDVANPADVARAMDGVSLVFHQAGIRITQCAEDPRLAMAALVDGTFNVLEAAVRAGVRKVIAASSASVYGAADEFPTAETHHPYDNRTIYGAAKLFNEGLLRSFNDMYGLDYIALRYFNVYGPRMDVHGAYTEVLVRWMDAIVAGRPPVLFGDGMQTMDFVYVGDVTRANLLAAASPVTDAVFNVATGVETSLNQLADKLLSVMHSPLHPEHAAARKVNPVARRVASVEQAWRGLGFRAEVTLDEGLRQLVEWWQHERSTSGAR